MRFIDNGGGLELQSDQNEPGLKLWTADNTPDNSEASPHNPRPLFGDQKSVEI